MISDKYKCIFVEVPKTGSRSIKSVIGGEPPKPHMNISQIANSLDIEKFQTYFKFGFVRNPWDRFVSLYERRQRIQMRHEKSFDEFIDWCKFSSCTCIHPLPHRYQLDWFVNLHGEIVVDFIGKFETLDNDWAFVCSKLGINNPLPHMNRNSQRKHYTEYYSENTRRIIAERFSVDIEYFGYDFYE